ncbi:hypothetical protein Lalb_Chr02g0153951 [Lupinus albus]|uniref:Uncharacterized protein n=1 Tax=Lupinus albus TaxID=3870 RepID=A0A6A4R1M7_LUPAL|nr:hypothetical protein Lalb_Chr02g0153951 [Lupinus albus]
MGCIIGGVGCNIAWMMEKEEILVHKVINGTIKPSSFDAKARYQRKGSSSCHNYLRDSKDRLLQRSYEKSGEDYSLKHYDEYLH